MACNLCSGYGKISRGRSDACVTQELSMGEHEQPIVGMRSAFDFSEEEAYDKEWTGREWFSPHETQSVQADSSSRVVLLSGFMVRHAEVVMSLDNVVVPRVVMGVEAREQASGCFDYMQLGNCARQSSLSPKWRPS
eukprot:3467501-Amphidinium_carterae.1